MIFLPFFSSYCLAIDVKMIIPSVIPCFLPHLSHPLATGQPLLKRKVDAITAWGFFTGLLHLYQALLDETHSPPPYHADSWVFKLETGMDHGDDLRGAGGLRPTVELFDLNGKLLGMNEDTVVIYPGQSTRDFVAPVNPTRKSVDPVYVTLTSRAQDPVCITELVVANPHGHRYAFSSSTAKNCGFKWVSCLMSYLQYLVIEGLSTPDLEICRSRPLCNSLGTQGRRLRNTYLHFPFAAPA